MKTVDATGLYVTPGLIDIHAHVYTNTGEPRSYAGDSSVPPDGFTFRVGVTTVVDAGGSGWRTFDDFKQRIIDRSKTRVLALLNIVGNGMRGGKYENNRRGHGREGDRREGEAVPRRGRRHQDGALLRSRMDAGRTRRRGGDDRQHSADGRLRQRPSQGASDRRPADEEAAARRHLHAHVFGPAARTAGRRQDQSGHDRRPQARRDLRRRPRRRQLPVSRRDAAHQAGLPARLDLDGPSHRQHERRHEGSAQRDEQVPRDGRAARQRVRDVDLESGEGDQAGRDHRPSLAGRGRGHRGVQARKGQVRIHRHVRREDGGESAADVRDDGPQRAHRLRPERHLASGVDVVAEGLPADWAVHAGTGSIRLPRQNPGRDRNSRDHGGSSNGEVES